MQRQPGTQRRKGRTRRRLALAWCAVAAIAAAVVGAVQADWTYEFSVPQPPSEAAVSVVDDDPPRLLSAAEAEDRVRQRAEQLRALAHAPAAGTHREPEPLPALPPEIAELQPAPPVAMDLLGHLESVE